MAMVANIRVVGQRHNQIERSKEGPTTYETIASLLAIWQIQKKDLKNELYLMLAANCC